MLLARPAICDWVSVVARRLEITMRAFVCCIILKVNNNIVEMQTVCRCVSDCRIVENEFGC